MCFDGSSLVVMNGVVYAQASQFSMNEVDVQMAVVDLDQIRAMRMANVNKENYQNKVRHFERVDAHIWISR